jgi:alkylresorcinol/alkylpyrone synthase
MNPGAAIAATATSVPPYVLTSDALKAAIGRIFDLDDRRRDALSAIIDNSQVKQRYTAFPLDHTVQPRPLSQVSDEFREQSIELGERAARDALERAGSGPRDVALLITVSCTGVMIPSLDAHLVNRLGFRSDVRRLPITELGCAAGAVALSRAADHVRAYPGSTVLVLAVELPTLTFQRADSNQANLISSVLFGDGAAAALVTGRPVPGPRIIDTESYLFPRTLDAMGFNLTETGFHIVLSRDVPRLIRERITELLESFLRRHGLTKDQIAAYVLHPGGQKLMAAIEAELGLCRCHTEPSWNVMRDYGNVSSATVLFVLDEWLDRRSLDAGAYGILAAFGPGFSAEMLLLQW